ncbi:MAG: hypothetical protein Q8R02_08680 [Hyphomonadaceae bacterium]|nr:hypothetical protein [Hyphomonadaceae bacterium]
MRLLLTAGAVLLSVGLSSPVVADTGILLADARSAESDGLATGEQLLLSSRNGVMPFASRQVQLEGFTGIAGYANELAYLAVIEGSASAGDVKAKAGWLLIFRPYGAPVTSEQFDAIRLSKQWSDAAKAASPSAFASLEKIKGGQELSVWLGRLGQTSYNVAASGSAKYEKATRTLMGNEAVRGIRFSGASDPMAVEQMVATRFLDALKSGDAKSAAALMDPTPFGGRALAGGANDARLMAASALIGSRDWTQVAGGGAPQLSEGVWRAGDAALQLRTIDDFVFVSRISGGAK